MTDSKFKRKKKKRKKKAANTETIILSDDEFGEKCSEREIILQSFCTKNDNSFPLQKPNYAINKYYK